MVYLPTQFRALELELEQKFAALCRLIFARKLGIGLPNTFGLQYYVDLAAKS